MYDFKDNYNVSHTLVESGNLKFLSVPTSKGIIFVVMPKDISPTDLLNDISSILNKGQS